MHRQTEAKPAVNILLVDDRAENLMVLEALLRSPEYRLVQATSGVQALEQLAADDFALILLDVQMPGMDGFETAQRIRQQPRSKNTPIIFVTAINRDPSYQRRGYEAGAIDFLFKPLDDLILRTKVAHFAELYRGRQAMLKEAELERYRLFANAMPQLVWTAFPDGRTEYLNQRWFDYAGIETLESWSDAIHPEDVETLLERWREALHTGKVFECEYRIRRASDGAYRWHLGRAVPIQSATGDGTGARIVRWFGTATDIQDQKFAQEEIQKALHARDEFLSIASHELKTPLTSLKLQLQLTQRTVKPEQGLMPSPDKLQKVLNSSTAQVGKLSHLIEDLLDVSRIQAGRLELKPEEVDLAELVRSGVEQFMDEFVAAECPVELSASAPVWSICDRFRMEQVVVNLLSNALKYGAGRPVSVSVGREGQMAVFRVRDSGIGIPKEKQVTIFHRFERAISASNISGLGLGLFIVKQIVDMHRGRIEVESEPGKGATFTVRVPLLHPHAGNA